MAAFWCVNDQRHCVKVRKTKEKKKRSHKAVCFRSQLSEHHPCVSQKEHLELTRSYAHAYQRLCSLSQLTSGGCNSEADAPQSDSWCRLQHNEDAQNSAAKSWGGRTGHGGQTAAAAQIQPSFHEDMILNCHRPLRSSLFGASGHFLKP